MAWTFFLKLFCLLVILSMLDCADARRRKKKERPGHAKLSRRSKNERMVDLKIGNKKRLLKLKKRQLRRINKRLSRKQMDVGYFSSYDETVGCLEECINELTNQDCRSRCLEQTKTGYSYVKENKAITVENDEDKLLFMDKEILKKGISLKQNKSGGKQGRNRKQRKQTILVPNIVDIQNSTGVIKLRLMVDSSFMKIFVNFSDGDVQAAKDEVEFFFALAMNRVALYFHSLKRLAVTFNTTNNVTFPLDLTVALENITFPPYNETTKSFNDVPPIAFNRRGEGENASLVINYLSYPNGTLIGSTGLFADFAAYMRGLFEYPISFDILQVITGDDLVSDQYVLLDNGPNLLLTDPSVTGIAYTGAFCSDYQPLPFDGRFGFVEFLVPYFDRVIAHELGHSLGAKHDGNERCAASDLTLITPFALPKVKNMTAEYYNISICSAEEIAEHFSSFTSDRIATCLYTDKPSVDDFLENYCKGMAGRRYDFNAHCRLFFGNDSFVCTEGNTDLKNGFVANDKCQSVLDAFFNYPPIFKCANRNSCENTTNRIEHIFDGSKCLNADGAQGDKVCFNGECLSDFTLCRNQTIAIKEKTKKNKKGKRRRGRKKMKKEKKSMNKKKPRQRNKKEKKKKGKKYKSSGRRNRHNYAERGL